MKTATLGLATSRRVVCQSTRKSAPSTLLCIERLDDRVMPSATTILAASLPVQAPPVAHISILDGHVSSFGGLSGGVVANNGHVSSFGGLSGGVVA